MNAATLAQLKAFFLDLDRHDAPDEEGRRRRARRRRIIENSLAAKLYLPRIRALFALLDAIPGAYIEEGDLGSALALLDKNFDGLVAAVWHFLEAYLRLPGVDEGTRKAAQAIRDAIVPSLGIVKAKYADEAAHAAAVEPKLGELADALALFPVVGGTLADWARRLIETGKGLGETQADRALSRADGAVDRSQVKVLRGQLVGEFAQLRRTLHDEFEGTQVEDFQGAEALVFAYLDELTG